MLVSSALGDLRPKRNEGPRRPSTSTITVSGKTDAENNISPAAGLQASSSSPALRQCQSVTGRVVLG
jgi:hypothetical protein